jgi:hypothetical protein
MEKPNQATGRCMCGAIRYACSGEPLSVAYCHCDDCRHHTGAPAVVWIAYDAGHVRYTRGSPKVYESSPGIGRAFCADCGTPLTWQAESVRFPGQHIVELYIGTLDDPNRYAPDRHWFQKDQLTWFETLDNLPRYSRLDADGVQPVHVGPRKN